MATQAQIEANRRNARRSTGPRTAEGKDTSRWNALRHGLAAEQPLLPHEDPTEYHQIRAELIATWQPANAQELMLVDQVAHGWRRMNRAGRFETSLLDLQARGLKHSNGIDPTPTPDDDAAIAASFFEDETENGFYRWCRYDSRAQSTYYRALTHLRNLINDRRRREERLESTYAARASAPASAAARTTCEIGFVPPRPLSTPSAVLSSNKCESLLP